MGKKEKSRKWDYWKEKESTNSIGDQKKDNKIKSVKPNLKVEKNQINGMKKNNLEELKKENSNVSKEITSKSKKGKTIGIVLGVLISLGIIVGTSLYLYKADYYKDKFFDGVKINSIECGGLTVNQVEEKIRSIVENYKITIEFRNEIKEVINGADIDYRYVSDGKVGDLQENQNAYKWIVENKKNQNFEVGKEISYDKEKLKNKLMELKSMQADQQENPENSIIIYDQNEFRASDEKQGTKIDSDKMLAGTIEAVSSSKTSLIAEELEVYIKPEITKDDVVLNENTALLNQYAKASITFDLPNGKEVLDGITLINWMSVNEMGRYYKDEKIFNQNIKEFVKELAAKYNTIGENHTFVGANGRSVSVSGGNYGWKINVKAEINKLTENINANEIIERKPEYTSEATTTENGGIGNTFVEIDLTAQHLWYHENGEVVLESDIVSGMANMKDRRTPGGVYTLYGKQRNRTLRGQLKPDGTYEYESPVKYWMPFNGGIGLHDASWKSKFGGTIYQYAGSHGCINLPTDFAAKIYEKIKTGTVIVCYYTD